MREAEAILERERDGLFHRDRGERGDEADRENRRDFPRDR